MRVRAHAPGRVNLIGDHTDYTGGWALPMAIDMGTTVLAERTGDRIALVSDDEPEPAIVERDLADPAQVSPPWARYIAGVVAELAPPTGLVGTVKTTLPIGAGLSSSAALEVAVALALGFDGPATALAQVCQRAEQRASGVPCGVMDQLAATSGVEGHALLMDCASLDVTPVPLPADVQVVVCNSGQPRGLADSAYALRRSQCEEAERLIGPLRDAGRAEVSSITDPVLQRRAKHVATENRRVLAFAEALRAADLAAAGALMAESHFSLRDDFEVSTPVLDELVARLLFSPGVYGARLTGAGFGGCVVALCEPGVRIDGWVVKPSGPASVREL